MFNQKGLSQTVIYIIVAIAVIILIGLYAIPRQAKQVQPTTQTNPTNAVQDQSSWKTYTDESGLSFSYPSNWTETNPSPARTGNTLVHFEGPEGFVELTTGTGFGGACPTDEGDPNIKRTTVFTLKGKDVVACDITNKDNSESFESIYIDLPNNKTGAIRAQANAPKESNQPVIMKVFSTFQMN